MLALGLLSIVQAAVLPGVLGVMLLRLADGALRTLWLGFALSVFFNYVLVLLLCAAGVYTPAAVYSAMGVEAAALAWLILRRGVGHPLGADLERFRALLGHIGGLPPARRLVGALALVAGAAAIGDCLVGLAQNAGLAFVEWDTVVSWNRFALDWYAGVPARASFSYPQLLPAVYSVTYQMIGTSDVQFFARIVAGLFPVAMYGAMIDLALRQRSPGYLVSAGAVRWVMIVLMGRYLMCGSADEPVGAAVFLAAACVVLAAEGGPDRPRLLVAGAICTGAAAATKQQGALLAAAYPVLVWLVMGPAAPMRRRLLIGAGLALIPALAVGPWYAYCALRPDGWGLGYIAVGIHQGRGLAARAGVALDWVARATGMGPRAVGVLTGVLLAAGLGDRAWRWIVVLVAAPLLALWLFMLGYDARNTAAVVPLLVTGAVQGVYAIGLRIGRRVSPTPRPALGYSVLALGALAAVAGLGLTRWRGSVLLRTSIAQRTGAGSVEINAALYRYAANPGFHGDVLTNYQILGFLPGLAPLYRFHNLTDENGLDAELARPATTHVLYFTFGGLCDSLRRRVESGRLVQVAKGDRFYLFSIRAPGPALGAAPGPDH